MSLISVEKACLAFGHHALLDNVDFALEPGEVVGLIGRNGAGKSSLLKGIAGAITLDDGRINIKGDVRVAYVAQEPELNPDDTVFDAVASRPWRTEGPAERIPSGHPATDPTGCRPRSRPRAWKPCSTNWKPVTAGSLMH
jgi:ATPase subunit of ABC transporter with duplicated ATPase domains